ncbi:MAG: Tetratricopeptide repeat protein [Bacteroidetes bacterium ADurb.Bin408]|nr:MAG: Tetratricopeptide repeat protein [Bacteroidetes bacterium ADurb.Bin408]
MSGMFFIMAMFFYLMGRTTQEMRKKITWFSLCILSGVSALASKENAVMLPIVLYIFDLLLIQGVSRENIKRQILIAFIPLAIIGALTFVLTNPSTFLSGYDSEYKLLDRLLTQPRVLLFYLSLMIYPIADRLTLIYDIPLSTSLLSPWTTTPSICFWLVWIGLGLYLAGKRPLFSFCLLFFVVNHFVESSFIPLELVFEHRNYIPSMMLFCLAGVGIITFINYFSNKRLLTCLVFIFLTIFIIAQGHTVFQRNSLFENPLFIWSDNVLKSPGLSRPYTYLGNVYWELGRYEDAKKAALSSIVGKYSRRHLQAVPLSNLANYYIYIQPSNPNNALNLYKQALRVAPEYWPARFGMATALLFLGQLDNARIQLEKTLAVAPRHRNVLLLYSLVLLKQNDFSSAFNQAKMALATDASPSLAYKVIGEVYRERKEYKQALGYWKRYSEANPTDIESLFARMYLSERMGDESELRKTAIETLLLKGNRTWDEFFKQIEFQSKTDIQIFSIEPQQARQLIQTALKNEIIKTMER